MTRKRGNSLRADLIHGWFTLPGSTFSGVLWPHRIPAANALAASVLAAA